MNIKVQYFAGPTDVTRFVNDPASAVAQIISITYDTASSKYVLFYT